LSTKIRCSHDGVVVDIAIEQLDLFGVVGSLVDLSHALNGPVRIALRFVPAQRGIAALSAPAKQFIQLVERACRDFK
jgi:hypothetical protein